MAIKKFEEFESTLGLVCHSCAMAIRSYCCAYTLAKCYDLKVVSNIAFELQWFTVQSGLLSLCRVWDQDARSLNDLIPLFESDFVRVEIESHIDSQEFFYIVTKLEDETAAVLSSKELKNVRHYRNKFLAHSTGADPNKNCPMLGNDFRILLDRTISIIDQLWHLLGKERNGLQKLFVLRLDECSLEWARIRNKDFMLEHGS